MSTTRMGVLVILVAIGSYLLGYFLGWLVGKFTPAMKPNDGDVPRAGNGHAPKE